MAERIDIEKTPIDDIRSRDLTPGLVAKAKKPKPTWFVKRLGDGYVFAVEEREAWDIINNRSEWKRHDFQFIGHSNGEMYKKIVDESIGKAQALLPEVEKVKKEINQYKTLEERLMIDEVVDMEGDPSDAANEENKKKVLRLRTIMAKLENKREKLEKEYRGYTSDVVKKAFDAELAVAKRNWSKRKVWPGAVNIITPDVNPRERNRILGAMSQGMIG